MNLTLLKLAAKLPSLFVAVAEALPEGVTADEAESIALNTDLGDLKVKVKGHDIIDDETQSMLQAALARIVVNITVALHG